MSSISKEEKKQLGGPNSQLSTGLTIEPIEHPIETAYRPEQKIETPKQKLSSSESGQPSKENTP